ncbi:Protein serine/threonine phosphatase 2C [Pleurostoma richardsiae]|uniref:Protein phosphatase n=1 Tax=Pleurostoma richardsiae TaxID=41990 RepID=A0AA38S743_9PEZI|nr:Protein serine/threonine phosphatase 2C [Pleurostoma richardsiae]
MAACATRPLVQSCRTPLRLSSCFQCALCTQPRLLSEALTRRNERYLSSSRALRSQPQQPERFTYNVAASYIAKDRPYDPSTHVFHFNPYNRVQPPKKRSKHSRPESGQDAFFVSRIDDTGGVAVGVADGVGGWMDSGVDPADFSHGFCDYMAAAAYEHRPAAAASSNESTGEVVKDVQALTARQLMQIGYDAVCADSSIQAGGSTAIVGLFEPDGVLEVANLGDSGFIHLRLNAVHACSEPQTHAFNTPFQLSVIPPSIMHRMAAFGGAHLSDLPRDAEVSRHRLRHGDVLVFASDGVWDNLFNQDILRLVSGAMRRSGAWVDSGAGIRVAPDLGPLTATREASSSDDAAAAKKQQQALQTVQSMIATEITFAAKAASVNTKLDGPFAKEVKKYYPQEVWHGGKVDDICVVAVVVSESVTAPVKSKL